MKKFKELHQKYSMEFIVAEIFLINSLLDIYRNGRFSLKNIALQGVLLLILYFLSPAEQRHVKLKKE